VGGKKEKGETSVTFLFLLQIKTTAQAQEGTCSDLSIPFFREGSKKKSKEKKKTCFLPFLLLWLLREKGERGQEKKSTISVWPWIYAASCEARNQKGERKEKGSSLVSSNPSSDFQKRKDKGEGREKKCELQLILSSRREKKNWEIRLRRNYPAVAKNRREKIGKVLHPFSRPARREGTKKERKGGTEVLAYSFFHNLRGKKKKLSKEKRSASTSPPTTVCTGKKGGEGEAGFLPTWKGGQMKREKKSDAAFPLKRAKKREEKTKKREGEGVRGLFGLGLVREKGRG